jgi:hypothetical protein
MIKTIPYIPSLFLVTSQSHSQGIRPQKPKHRQFLFPRVKNRGYTYSTRSGVDFPVILRFRTQDVVVANDL